MSEIRVRFAPSPTGPLHIGGVRTALFNYVFAKQNSGKFILRIEDTDQTRYVQGAENYIIESLKWLGLNYDEGVDVGGEFAPYRQSERKDIYKKYAQQLVEQGKAYYAFDTPEELDQMRKRLEEQKSSVRHYNYITRGEMKNSFTLSEDEVNQRISNGEPFVVRFNMPQDRTVELNDIVRGKMTVDTSTLDDKILFKSDGLPTYHLANIVDDHLMKISHVIRGEEWLPSLALHILLYEAFGWQPPKFAHLPLILKPNGKGKLSKRDGDQMGFPVFPLEWTDPQSGEKYAGYRENGYLPEAVVNILALLGWHPGDNDEVLTLDQIIKKFDITKVQKGGAKFDPDKAKWFNQLHLRRVPKDKLVENFMKILKEKGISANSDFVGKVVDLTIERAVFERDLWQNASYFFIAPEEYDAKALKKHWKGQAAELVEKSIEWLKNVENFNAEYLEKNMIEWIQEQGVGLGKVLNPIRLLLVGATSGPHLFDIMEMLGKDETVRRLEIGLTKLEK